MELLVVKISQSLCGGRKGICLNFQLLPIMEVKVWQNFKKTTSPIEKWLGFCSCLIIVL